MEEAAWVVVAAALTRSFVKEPMSRSSHELICAVSKLGFRVQGFKVKEEEEELLFAKKCLRRRREKSSLFLKKLFRLEEDIVIPIIFYEYPIRPEDGAADEFRLRLLIQIPVDSSCVGRVVHTEIEIPPNIPLPAHPDVWHETTDIRFFIRALVAVEMRF